MLTMSWRNPVLNELQDQTEESSHSAAAAVQSTRLATHRARPQNPALQLHSAQSGGEIPADTNTLPAFYLSNKVSCEEPRAFPRGFREHTTSLQH